MAGKALLFELIASDKASPAFMRVAGAADKAAASTERATKSMGAASARMGTVGASLTKHLTLPLLAVGAVSVAQAAKWQKAMTLIQTAGGETAAKTAVLSKGLMKIATDTGTSLDQLGEGIYTIAKAGAQKWSATDQLLVMKAAAQGAKAEHVDLRVATDALSTVMLDYHLSASKAVGTENQLIRASGLAKTTFTEFTSSLSNVMPIASALGISIPEVTGALATMTQHGVSAQQATENLRNLLFNLSGQNNVASQAMQQLGINTVDLTKNLGTRGLTGTLAIVDKALKDHTKDGMVVVDVQKAAALATGSLNTMLGDMGGKLKDQSAGLLSGKVGITEYTKYAKSLGGVGGAAALQFRSLYLNALGFSNQLKSGKGTITTSTAQYAKLLGGMTGAAVAMQIGGKYAADNARNVREIGKAALEAGSDVLGWNKTQDTLAVKMDKAKASLQVMAVEIGTALIPAVSKIADGVSKAVGWFTSLSKTDKKILGWSALVLVALGPILSIFARLSTISRWRTAMIGGFRNVGSAAVTSSRTVAGAETAQTRAIVTETDIQIASIERMRALAGAPVVMGPVVPGRGMPVGGVGGAAARPRGSGMGGMIVGSALLIGGPMIGPAVGGTKGSGRNIAGTIGADAATGAGIGMIVGGPLGGAVGGGVGGVYGAVSATRNVVVDGHGSIAPAGAPATPPIAVSKPKPGWFDKIPSASSSKLGFFDAATGMTQKWADQSVAALKRLDRAEQETALRNSVLGKSLRDLAGNNISTGEATKTFGTALHDIAGRAKDSNQGLVGVNNASKTNRAYMIAAMTAAEQHAAALQKSGASAKTVEKALLGDVSALEKTALKAGFNKTEFEGMLKTMGLTPKQIHTVMDSKTDTAKQKIADLQAKINAIKQHKVPSLSTNPAGAKAQIDALQAQIDALRGKTLDIWINTHNITLGGPSSSNRGVAVPHAAGGSVADGWFTVGERGWELGHKSGNTVKLLDNKTSQKLTGLHRVPGFATGTPGSSAQADRNIDQAAAATSGLISAKTTAASAAAASAAAAQAASERAAQLATTRETLAAFLATARSSATAAAELSDASKSLRDAAHDSKVSSAEQSRLAKDSALLGRLGSARDKINAKLGTPSTAPPTAYERLDAAKSAYSDSVNTTRSAITGSFDITTAGQNSWGVSTTSGIMAAIQKAAANAARFATLVKRLAKEGLNKSLIEQLTAAGPSALGAAQALAAATPKQIASINSSYKSLTNTGNSLGKAVADDFYKAGVTSAESMVKGLLTKRSLLNKTISNLALEMVVSLDNSLGLASGKMTKAQYTAAEKKLEATFNIKGITDPEAFAQAVARRLAKLVA